MVTPKNYEMEMSTHIELAKEAFENLRKVLETQMFLKNKEKIVEIFWYHNNLAWRGMLDNVLHR